MEPNFNSVQDAISKAKIATTKAFAELEAKMGSYSAADQAGFSNANEFEMAIQKIQDACSNVLGLIPAHQATMDNASGNASHGTGAEVTGPGVADGNVQSEPSATSPGPSQDQTEEGA